MTFKFRILSLAAVALLGAGAASAAVPFARADRNKDGVVDYEEAQRAYPGISEAQVRRMDINRDGVIDQREYPQLDAIYEVLIRSQ